MSKCSLPMTARGTVGSAKGLFCKEANRERSLCLGNHTTLLARPSDKHIPKSFSNWAAILANFLKIGLTRAGESKMSATWFQSEAEPAPAAASGSSWLGGVTGDDSGGSAHSDVAGDGN